MPIARDPISGGILGLGYLGKLLENKQVQATLDAYDVATKGIPGYGLIDDAARVIGKGGDYLAALPIAMRSPALKELIKKKFNIDLEGFPTIRYQKEAVDYPVSKGGRGQIFTSYGDEFEGYSSIYGSEGGPHKVVTQVQPKNPLILERGPEFIAHDVMKKLMGEREAGRLKAMAWKATDQGPAVAKKTLKKYLSPKEIEAAYQSEARRDAFEEALAASLARRAGYDTIISVRPKTFKYVDKIGGFKNEVKEIPVEYNPTQVSLLDKAIVKRGLESRSKTTTKVKPELKFLNKDHVDWLIQNPSNLNNEISDAIDVGAYNQLNDLLKIKHYLGQ